WTVARTAPECHRVVATVEGSRVWSGGVRRTDRNRPWPDQPGAAVRKLLVLWVSPRDIQRQDGDHAGGHANDQELCALERGVQPDAQSQVRSVRPAVLVAGFASPGALRPQAGQASGRARG